MTMGEQIAEFLVRHNGQAFCDNCLRGALKTKNVRAVERATKAMGAKSRLSATTDDLRHV